MLEEPLFTVMASGGEKVEDEDIGSVRFFFAVPLRDVVPEFHEDAESGVCLCHFTPDPRHG